MTPKDDRIFDKLDSNNHSQYKTTWRKHTSEVPLYQHKHKQN